MTPTHKFKVDQYILAKAKAVGRICGVVRRKRTVEIHYVWLNRFLEPDQSTPWVVVQSDFQGKINEGTFTMITRDKATMLLSLGWG